MGWGLSRESWYPIYHSLAVLPQSTPGLPPSEPPGAPRQHGIRWPVAGGAVAVQALEVLGHDAVHSALIFRVRKKALRELLIARLEGLERVEPRVLKINRRRDVPLWSSVWFLLIAVLLPSIEWFLRRRWGLL